MEFKEVIKNRQSCRKYRDQPVEREKLIACIEAARLSPSSCNSQRWIFVLVDEPEQRAQVAQALEDLELRVNTFASKIPAFIVVVMEPSRNPTEKQRKLLGEGLDRLWDIDIGIVAEQICLSATDQGLSTVMMGHFRQEMLKEVLDIPSELHAPLVIGVGYPETDVLKEKIRRPLEDIARDNSYRLRIGHP